MASRGLIISRAAEFAPQGLTNTAWAFATAGMWTEELSRALQAAVAAAVSLSDFKPIELANLVWSFAKSGYEAPATYERVGAEVVRRLVEFSPQGVTNVLWAYATQGHCDAELFDEIASHLVLSGRLRQFNEQELSLTVWAYATMAHPAPQMFDALAEQAISRAHELSPQVGRAHDLARRGPSPAQPSPESTRPTAR